MRLPAAQFGSEADPSVVQLRQRLDAFYAAPGDYSAFMEPNWKPEYWGPVKECVDAHIACNGRCRVLEVGAGRTSFGTYLGDVRKRVEFHAQDVTPANRAHLESEADEVHIGSVLDIRQKYDVVFSTFVWEHMSNPSQTLHCLIGMLNAGGKILIASPRYDFPGYLSPSARHLALVERGLVVFWLLWRRTRVALGGRADFLIHLDPAVLRGQTFRDADAIHWVSLWDLEREFSGACEIERIRIPTTGLLGRFWEKYLLLFVALTSKGGEKP